ncbi:MAG: dihydropteroate synthase [Planctomycetia bacterium]|nr:dihydropteroate synthase [Planctomycetia bacterium]
MPIAGLNIIGESLNDSVPSTQEYYTSEDWDGICELAQFQESHGAKYIDVNVGSRDAHMMSKVVDLVQKSVKIPLSIDSPDLDLARAGLQAYSGEFGKPILNSISPLRTEMFELYKIRPFRPILLISEYINEEKEEGPARTAKETFTAAWDLFSRAKYYNIPNDDMIFDPGIAPIGSDFENNLARLLEAMQMIRDCEEMKGVHFSVGLSNFTVMLPPKTKSGSTVKSPLESAFLTLAMPLGLDYIVGSVKRKYEILAEDHPALCCIKDCLRLGGFESISRIREFYTS